MLEAVNGLPLAIRSPRAFSVSAIVPGSIPSSRIATMTGPSPSARVLSWVSPGISRMATDAADTSIAAVRSRMDMLQKVK